MSIAIDCNENILRAFPMLSAPVWQLMCTDCVYHALQDMNRPVRCKEIRQWVNNNADFPRDVTVEMIAACCRRLVKMGLVKRETVDGIIREIPREDFCSWGDDVEYCKECQMCHFNEDHSKVLVKESISYYSLV